MNRTKLKRKAGCFLKGVGSIITLSPNHALFISLSEARATAAKDRANRLARIRKTRLSAKERAVQLFEAEVKNDQTIPPAVAAKAIQGMRLSGSLTPTSRKLGAVNARRIAISAGKVAGSASVAKLAMMGRSADPKKSV